MLKEGQGWKAAYNEAKGVYGAEVVFQGSWELYEISAADFSSLTKNMPGSEAERIIQSGRRLYSHVNDNCGPAYNVVLDEAYADYCPWMADSEPAGKTWDPAMTAAVAELFGLENKK
jgi:hypothetical protein